MGVSRILSMLATACALLAGNVWAQSAGQEEILSFDSDITVREDASMRVRETIRIRCNGVQIKRGIYRDFPTRYRSARGTRYVVKFDVTDVLRDGRPEPYKVTSIANGKRVRIGEADVFLKPGEYTYTIHYETDRQLGFFSDHDELYWNVTGLDWAFRIREASATLHLPPEIPRDELKLEAYTGPEGAKGKSFQASVDESGSATFKTTSVLEPHEGLTIVVAWPKGYVTEPTGMMKAGYLLSRNLGLLIGLVGLTAVSVYYLSAWMKVGRDPEKGTIIPLFEPPAGFGPAASRFVMRMGYDDKAFAAAIINMAVKGYLTISDDDGTYTLTRSGADDQGLTPDERAVAKKLFGTKDSIEIRQKNHRKIGGAVDKLKKSLESKLEKRYFLTNSNFFVIGLVASFVCVILSAIAYSPGVAVFLSIWLTGWSVAVVFLLRQAIVSWYAVFTARGRLAANLASAIGASLFALPFTGFEVFGLFALTQATSITVLVIVLLMALLNVAFYHLLKARTGLGRELMDKLEGFRMFLSVAERDRLNMLNPPERTPELFERYLPYALAMDVEQQWGEQFADVLALASAGDTPYSPVWYSGSSWRDLGAARFASSLGSSFASSTSAASTAPGSSSGSGGGGSSGGGGGGGGGGGW